MPDFTFNMPGFNDNRGWICPRCSRVYAPHVMTCWHCNHQIENGVTITGAPLPADPPTPFETNSTSTQDNERIIIKPRYTSWIGVKGWQSADGEIHTSVDGKLQTVGTNITSQQDDEWLRELRDSWNVRLDRLYADDI